MDSPADMPALIKVSPGTLSNAAAWSLFDRSVASGFLPGADVVAMELDRSEQLWAFKIYGSAPYRLHVSGRDGSTIGFSSIDLSKLPSGWNVIEASSLTSTRRVELRFEPLAALAPIPEIELWAVDRGDDAITTDITGQQLPPNYVSLRSTSDAAELPPDECATFELEVARTPRAFDKAYLLYEAEPLFRSFSLRRSVNGLAEHGGVWLQPDVSKGSQSFVDEISPSTLHVGSNTVRLCVPENASHSVAVANVRLVGRLDRGRHLVTSVSVGGEDVDVPSLHDRNDDTASSFTRGQHVVLSFDRLIAPDALVLIGHSIDAASVGAIDCIDRKNTRHSLVSHSRASSDGLVIELDSRTTRCATMEVTFTADTTITDFDVAGSGAAERVDWPRIVVTSEQEHFGDNAWVGGFIARPPVMAGAIRVEVAGTRAQSMSGDFGRMLERNTDLAAPWEVVVTAKYPDSTIDARRVLLGHDARSQSSVGGLGAAGNGASRDDARYGRVGDTAVTQAMLMRSTRLRLGTEVGLDIPAGAVTASTNIKGRRLGTAALPPLDPGMINVTAPKGHGYEFLPHGQRFARAVDVTLPFDPKLVPSSMSPNDVHTYYFDANARRWKKLDRKDVDVRGRVTRSVTDHFTIMINAVLAAPTNPTPLSFDPTSISSIGVATPAAGIDLMEPPTANSTGDARLALPIRLPPGRGAYSPSLAIRYSSAAENGWLGVGWDLSTSSIEIDTRWGVPTYADGEEPRYLLDGAALVPTGDSDGPTCTLGGTAQRYHARVEGAFVHILRCGTDPSNYYFQLHDRDGTKYIYGRDGNASVRSTKPRPCGSACGLGIFRWNLRRVEDVYSNTTTFEYYVDDTPGVELGRAVYPQRTLYTAHAASGLPAKYSVEFLLDDGSRPDRIINGRGGFKMYTRRLLRAVRVKFESQVIREYVLTYHEGQFEKTVLSNVRMYGVGGCAAGTDAFAPPSCGSQFHEHGFAYYSGPQGFGQVEEWPVQWQTPMDPQPALMTLGKGTTKTTNANLSLDIGSQDASGSVGANYSIGAREEAVGLYDVNGDGLADQLFTTPTGIRPFYNRGLANRFDEYGPALSGLVALGGEKQSSWGISTDVAGNAGPFNVSASGGYSSGTSRAHRFMTDLDGDGFVDFLSAQPQRSESCPTGHCFTPVAFSAISQIDPNQDPTLNEIAEELDEQHMTADPVVRWVAPYSGTASIDAYFRLAKAGDVTIELYLNDTLLSGWPKTLSSAGAYIADSRTIQIHAGDVLYARVLTGASDGISGAVLNDVVFNGTNIRYSFICNDLKCTQGNGGHFPSLFAPYTAYEPTKEPAFNFSTRELSPGGGPIVAPIQGTMELSGWLRKSSRSAADLRVCVQRFPAGTTQTDFGCNDPNSPATLVVPGWNAGQSVTSIMGIGGQFPVDAGDLIVLRLESDFSFEPYAIWFERNGPVALKYVTACIPNDNGPGCTATTDPDVLAALPIDQSEIGLFIAPTTPPEPFGAAYAVTVSKVSETWKIFPFPNPQGTQPVTIAFRSNQKGTFLVFDCNTALCTPPGATPTHPYVIEAPAGESFSFEVIGEKVLFPPVRWNIELLKGSTQAWVRWIFRNKRVEPPASTPFAGGHRGFSGTFWNESIPFEPRRLLEDYANPSNITFERAVEIASTAIAPRPLFTNLVNRYWVAPGSVATIRNGGEMHAAKAGITPPGLPGELVDPRGDLFTGGYGRLSATQSWYLGGNASASTGNWLPIISIGGSIGGTATRSRTLTTTDILDVTGDGIADAVAPNRVLAGNLSGATATLAPFHFNDAIRRRKGVDYMLGLGAVASIPRTNAAGRFLSSIAGKPVGGGGVGINTSTGLSLSRSETVEDLADINGDGLVDGVRRLGTELQVRYNFGTSLGAWETISTTMPTQTIDGFQQFEGSNDPFGESFDSSSDAIEHASTLTQHENVSVNLLFAKYSYSKRKTSSRVVRQLADLNGDALPDIVFKTNGQPIYVQYNLGDRFTNPTTWSTPAWNYNGPIDLSPAFNAAWDQLDLVGPDVLAGTSSQDSVSHSGSVTVPWIPDVLSSTIGLARSNDTDTYELALVDITGDGKPDHVLRRGAGGNTKLYVKRNSVGYRSNLLASVNRPLRGRILLSYDSLGNTVAMPQQRQVLTRVEVDDGVDLGLDFASPNLVTTFSYEDGYHHRQEKEFFGFAKVITHRADGATVEQQFNNLDYALRGRLLREIFRDDQNRMYSEHAIGYDVRDVVGPNGPLTAHPLCTQNVHPLLARVGPSLACTPKFPVVIQDDDTRAEGGGLTKTRTTQDTDIDRFGNVLASTDTGDSSIAGDDLYTHVSYANDTTSWILGRPTSLDVRAGTATSTKLRSRGGTYNAQGKLTHLHVETGYGTATTQLDYNAFGNLRIVTTPPNENGQSQTYEVTAFDSVVATYPVTMVNGFGETSNADYDLRFGVATTETDVNGASIVRTLDGFGRLATVHGPYDTSAPGLTFEYYPTENPPRAVTVTRASAPSDYSGPLPPPITTVTLADGLERPIELRKTVVVGGTSGMTTSGLVQRDLLGRVTKSYHPFFTPGASTVYVPPQVTLATTTAYDVLDRVVSVTYPDNASETTSYALVMVPNGWSLFHAQHIDANGNARETYSDHLGRTRSQLEHPTTTTTAETAYDYLGTGELLTIEDAEGNVTRLEYDFRGLRTRLDNPDTGLIEDVYDLMGNRTATIEPNHRALGSEVHFTYDRDRLVEISYPSKPNVGFVYGQPGASHGRVGRISVVHDESGIQENFYGSLGEGRRTVRTIAAGPQGGTALEFDLKLTSDSLGRLLQIQYPDGEIVTNTYDAGGNLSQVDGEGANWTRTYVYELLYDVFGNRTHLRRGNDVATTWEYDPQRVRLTDVVTELPSGPRIQSLHYDYDSNGNPTQIQNALDPLTTPDSLMPGRSLLTLMHDGVGRLVTASGQAELDPGITTTYQQTFVYSASHNLLNKDRNHSINGNNVSDTTFSSTYQYGTRPHLPDTIGNLTIVYDPSGNPIERRGGVKQDLIWDDDNRLVQLTTPDVNQLNVYDAAGLRVRRQTSSAAGHRDTVFSSPYFDVENETQGIKHIFAGELRIASALGEYNSGQNPAPPADPALPFYFATDHLGSTSVITAEDGSVYQSLEYFVDGETWIDRAPKDPNNGYLFNGKPFDQETGFYDYGQRFYDPRTSLWLGVDPAFVDAPGVAVRGPMMLSQSAYAALNPVRFIDPDGRHPADHPMGCGGQTCEKAREQGRKNQRLNIDLIGVGKGFARSAKNAAKGVVHAVTHPRETAEGIGYAITHPVQTAKAVGRGISNTVAAVVSGDSEAIGDAFFEAASLFTGGAIVTKAVTKIGKLAQASKLIKPLGRGSTVNGIDRWLPRNLREQLAVDQAMQSPAMGRATVEALSDSRWPASDGWVKLQQTIDPGGRGGPISVHYNFNKLTGEVDDFKIVARRDYIPPDNVTPLENK